MRSQIVFKKFVGGAGAIKVSDCFFYCVLTYLVVGSTFGYSSSDVSYQLGTFFGLILLSTSILTRKYSQVELAVLGIMAILALAIAVKAHSLTILLTVLIIAASKGMKLRSIIIAFSLAKISALACLVIFGTVGLFDTTSLPHYSGLLNATINRLSINGVHTNVLHLGYFCCVSLIIYLDKNRPSLFSLLAMMFANILVYLEFTFSSGGLLVTSFLILSTYFCSRFETACKLFRGLSRHIVPFTVVLFIYTGYAYGGVEWISRLNHITTGRIAYNHYWLTSRGMTLFGTNPAGAPAAFDNSVVYLVVGLGIAAAAVFLYGYHKAIGISIKTGSTKETVMIVSFYLFSMSESMLPSVVVNPSLFVVLSLLDRNYFQLDDKQVRARAFACLEDDNKRVNA